MINLINISLSGLYKKPKKNSGKYDYNNYKA